MLTINKTDEQFARELAQQFAREEKNEALSHQEQDAAVARNLAEKFAREEEKIENEPAINQKFGI